MFPGVEPQNDRYLDVCEPLFFHHMFRTGKVNEPLGDCRDSLWLDECGRHCFG